MTSTPLPAAVAAQTSTPSRRPFGLLAIIFLQVLTALLSALALVLMAAAMLAVISAAGDATATGGDLQLSNLDILTFVLTLVVNAICAVGLWRRKRWAWFLTMLQLGFFMLSDLYSYFTDSPVATYAWSMLLNILMVFYLNQREVQNIFMHKTPTQSSPPVQPVQEQI